MKKIKWYEKEFKAIKKQFAGKKELTLFDFLRARNYKLNNYSEEKEKSIRDTTKKAFEEANKNQIEQALTTLCELHGVRIPVASAILAMRYPKKYAVIDRKVVEIMKNKKWLDKKFPNKVFSSKRYVKYLTVLNEKCRKGQTPRQLEFKLFKEAFILSKTV